MVPQFRLSRALVIASFVASSIVCGPLWAPPLPPPSKVLQSPRTQVVVGTYVDRLADGRYRFKKVDDLRGPDSAPDEIVVRGPDWLLGWLSPNTQYLFAYTAYARNPRFRKETIVDTNGPQLIDSSGLEPALFIEAAGLREQLIHTLDKPSLQTDAFIEQIAAGLGSTDIQLQNFYAAELNLLPDLGKRKDKSLVKAVTALLKNADGHPTARATLLRVAAANPGTYSRALLTEVVDQVLLEAPLVGYQDPHSRDGELLSAALQLTREPSFTVRRAALERLVSCDNSALAEDALLALRSHFPEHERSAVLTTLKQTQLPTVTREFLLDHLRRLDLAAKHLTKTVPES